MTSISPISTENAAKIPTGFGRKTRLSLLLSSAAFVGCLVANSYYLPYAKLGVPIATVSALLASAIAIVQLIRHPPRRTRGSITLVVVTVVAALPAWLYLTSVALMALPVTPWERSAIKSAEAFLLRNGYTAVGHPKDLPVLSNDIMEFGLAEEIVEERRNTVRAHAVGICGTLWSGYDVLFEYTASPPTMEGVPRNSFVVRVAGDGRARKPHMMPLWPDWMCKRNEP